MKNCYNCRNCCFGEGTKEETIKNKDDIYCDFKDIVLDYEEAKKGCKLWESNYANGIKGTIKTC
jgi:hypothetical protein